MRSPTPVLVFVLAAAMLAHATEKQQKKSSVKKALKFEDLPETGINTGEKLQPEVKLSLGGLVGFRMKSRGHRPIVAFTAIPYAQPPVEELRFKAPRPVKAWSDSRKSVALDQVPSCVQTKDDSTQGQEDCLYLNVFTPSVDAAGNVVADKKLPVVVWIHGGLFTWGRGSSVGPEYLLDKNIVLVTINYRLGPLGFLSTEDKECSGNWGLKDQVMALRWVREHINHFGGCPKQVTLAGHSSGGISVHLHMVSQLSKGLFHRAISQSGTGLSLGVPQSRGLALRRAQRLAQDLGCPATPSWKLVLCARKKSAEEIVNRGEALREWGAFPSFLWGPVLEDFITDPKQHEEPFLDEEPTDTLSQGMGQDIPWLSGVTSAEGGFTVADMLNTARQLEAFDQDFSRLAPLALGYHDTAPSPDEVTQEIKDFYFGDQNITRASSTEVTNMFTDALFLSGVDESMRLHSAFSSVPSYLYLFNHRGQRSMSESVGGGDRDYGVVHGDELQYLFPTTEMPLSAPMTPTDRNVSDLLIDLWTNFARAGNPTPKGNQRYKFPWKAVESDDLEFMEVGQGGRVLRGAGLQGHRAHFWATLPLTERHVRNMHASAPVQPQAFHRTEL